MNAENVAVWKDATTGYQTMSGTLALAPNEDGSGLAPVTVRPFYSAFPYAESKNDAGVPVYLSPFTWHLVLKELEYATQIRGRDTKNLKKIWEMISTQLNEVPVKFVD